MLEDRTLVASVIAREFGEFSGKTVKVVREMTPDEREDMGWDDYSSDPCLVIVFTDGTALIVSQDPEGNGGGWLFPIDGTA